MAKNIDQVLASTLRRYVEGMGGTLELVAQFPNRSHVVIGHRWVNASGFTTS